MKCTIVFINITQYSRNSIFSGLLPSEIEKRFPDKWKNDEDEEEKTCLRKISLLINYKDWEVPRFKHSYTKITNIDFGRKVVNRIPNMKSNDINVIVYNFVDIKS